ncbi:MAG: cobalamin-dependent protein [Pseudomonadota bacterium]|nr:cobalamin-dependent protein [Pseudomonadota bacterium]
MKIVLLSPKGPLYRHRTGIFRKSLRYAPLTLTTLASLIPEELNATVRIFDEGVEEIPLDVEADLVGITVITGTTRRAYELSSRYRERGIPVVLGGPHVTLVPDEAQQYADSIVTGYAEASWPELLLDLAAGEMRARYTQQTDFTLENLPFPKRNLLDRKHFLTTDVFEATRSCSHSCDFCVAPAAWGRHPYQKPVEYVVEDIRREGARKLIFVDLNLISDPKTRIDCSGHWCR